MALRPIQGYKFRSVLRCLINNFQSMKKFLTFLTVLLLTQAITDTEILQQVANGFFERNNLPKPTTVVPCIDDATAKKIVAFGGDILAKAAKGKMSDLVGLIKATVDFQNQIPQQVQDCLDGNQEQATLSRKYGVEPTTNPLVIAAKATGFVTWNFNTVHNWVVDLNNNFKAGNYYKVGYDAAGEGRTVLGISSKASHFSARSHKGLRADWEHK